MDLFPKYSIQSLGSGHWVNTLYSLRPNADVDDPLNCTYNAEEIAFGQKVQEYWYSFLTNGNPSNNTAVQVGGLTLNNQLQQGTNYVSANSPSQVQWSAYNALQDNYMELGWNSGSINIVDNTTIYMTTSYYNGIYDYYDAVIPQLTYTIRCAMGYATTSNNTCVQATTM